MITTIYSVQRHRDGNLQIINIEVEVTKGIGIHLIGLADAQAKESLLRIVTAIQSIGYSIPGKKIVINLAPADIRKNGAAGYDLPIAIGILAAAGQIKLPNNQNRLFAYGMLTIDGKVKHPMEYICGDDLSQFEKEYQCYTFKNGEQIFRELSNKAED